MLFLETTTNYNSKIHLKFSEINKAIHFPLKQVDVFISCLSMKSTKYLTLVKLLLSTTVSYLVAEAILP